MLSPVMSKENQNSRFREGWFRKTVSGAASDTPSVSLSLGDSGGSKKGGKKKGSSFQTVSAVFRVGVPAASTLGGFSAQWDGIC